ncbi:MAG: helix-turn-helix domain-containing protein [Alkaliphilus sp.]
MENKEIKVIFERAKKGNKEAIEKILILFEPLIRKHSLENGSINEDYFQELSLKLIKCIQVFKHEPKESELKNFLEQIID